jgi:hypothetical protein
VAVALAIVAVGMKEAAVVPGAPLAQGRTPQVRREPLASRLPPQ